MNIIKSNGDSVAFDSEKVLRSIKRTGAGDSLAREVLDRVELKLTDGMSTRELYKIVRKELGHQNACFACRYNLREAILKLGPAGFKFEKYVASILRAYRYEAMNPEQDIRGACTNHEVDVVAEKEGRKIFIEAKFRNDYRGSVDLKDTMATWSRFIDLVDASSMYDETPHFDECWIVTNARFSDRARQFGVCKGMRMIGWNHPAEMTFSAMVDHVSLYPVTVIDSLQRSELEAFADKGLLICREISEIEPHDLAQRLGFKESRARELVELCGEIVEGEQNSKHGHK